MSKQNLFIMLIAFVAAIGGFLFGFDTGIISGALKFITIDFGIDGHNALIQEIIVSSVPAGALLGAILSSFSANRLGRHDSIIISSVLFTIGTLIIVFANFITFVVLGRFILGLSVGLSAMIVPMYISEVSPAKIRGSLIFVFQLAITIGILFSYLVNYYFAETANWRAMFAVGILPSVLLGIGMSFLPRSPRWLLLRNRNQEAKLSLQRIRPGQNIEQEFKDILSTCSNTGSASFKSLFSKDLLPLVLISFGLFAVQQLSGINTIFYYAPKIFAEAGITSDSDAILASVVCGATNVLATFLGIYLVEKLGRRKLLFSGLTGLIISLFGLSLGYHGYFGQDFTLVTVILILSIIIFFATSLAGIPYIIMAEIFPLRVRHLSMATASCANWGFNILVSATFLSAIEAFGIGNTYLIYGFCTTLGLIMAYKYLPETKSQTLESIERSTLENKGAISAKSSSSSIPEFEEDELAEDGAFKC